MTKSFLSYVDLKKEAQIDICSEDKDLEKGVATLTNYISLICAP